MNREKDSKFDLLAVLLLLCVFSVLVLSLLRTGARTYKGITYDGRAAIEQQTDALYITKRIAQAPAGVYAVEDGGVSCLRFPETIGGERYVTRIYCHDGWVKELFSAEDVPFDPSSGEKVIKAESMQVRWEYGYPLSQRVLWVELKTEYGLLKLPFADKVETFGYEK